MEHGQGSPPPLSTPLFSSPSPLPPAASRLEGMRWKVCGTAVVPQVPTLAYRIMEPGEGGPPSHIFTHHHTSSPIITHHHPSSPITHHHPSSPIIPLHHPS
ncbi:hypothetical protein CLOP_g3017 [Closterium sp. NIES-67]|nr:hypothetical protein CLOP_g3017 [Closterium sp. NIES-67]